MCVYIYIFYMYVNKHGDTTKTYAHTGYKYMYVCMCLNILASSVTDFCSILKLKTKKDPQIIHMK